MNGENSDESSRPGTRLVTGGRRKSWRGSLVNVPVERTSTVLFDSLADMRASYPPEAGRPSYGRNGTATGWSLAEALTALEPGAAGTRLFPSGLAAIAVSLLAVVSPGDELLVVDSAYGPTRIFCDTELARLGVTTRYFDPAATADDIADLATERTRAVFLESPGSLSFEVMDVPGICAMARDRGLVTVLDNTWATPLFFQAMAAGIDLSILACTKYIGGHSDVMMGSVTATAEWWPALDRTGRLFGQHVSPDDAYLVARGLRTLEVRLRKHEQSALQIARWLRDHKAVSRVLHPALETCPGHDYWKRDFGGSSGLFTFILKDATEDDRDALIERLELFGIGYSWGGYESLAVPADPHRTAASLDWPGPAVRLHIGLEDTDDLIADLDRALAGL